MSDRDPEIARLLTFWLGSSDPALMADSRQEWWVKDPAFDRAIIQDFGFLFQKAVDGDVDHWREDPLGCLGLILLHDQFPRNMFRGNAQAFAYDEKARTLCRHALAQGFDQTFGVGGKLFIYLPLEHSEDLQDQRDCLALMEKMGQPEYVEFAQKHLVIIERFGRFPHRNDALGRPSTPEEIAFLKQPGSSF